MRNIKFISILITTIAFTVLFWQENLGLNLVIFSQGTIVLLSIYHKTLFNRRSLLISLLATFCTALFVLFNNTHFAITMHIISFVGFVGMIQQREIKDFILGVIQILEKSVLIPLSVSQFVQDLPIDLSKIRTYSKKISLLVAPIIIVIAFYFMYLWASPFFAKWNDTYLSFVGDFFDAFWKSISFTRILFTLLGFLVAVTIFVKLNPSHTATWASTLKLQFERKRKKLNHQNSFIDLKKEKSIALISFLSMNILLLIVNVLDIQNMWFGFEMPRDFNLKQFVHAGTYTLIVSILLSMGITFYFFRNNLNFIKNNTWLKRSAQAWIIQNIILSFSVGIRNYHYISFHGLAYLRIGVFLFLITTIVGLVLLYIKVGQTKSNYYV